MNSLILDPSFPNTLYAGTDVGAFVTYNGGANWSALGTGFPLVAIWQLALDPSHRVLAAGTHGRGAYTVADTHSAPALVLSKVDAGKPVGASSNVNYTITLKNIGNAAATNSTISDPVPANTSFVSAQDGGTFSAGNVTWTGAALAPGDSTTVHFTVSIAAALKNKVGVDRQRRPEGDRGRRLRHDRLAVRHAARSSVRAQPRPGGAAGRRPRRARASRTS